MFRQQRPTAICDDEDAATRASNYSSLVQVLGRPMHATSPGGDLSARQQLTKLRLGQSEVLSEVFDDLAERMGLSVREFLQEGSHQ
jgi:hypothetical protein